MKLHLVIYSVLLTHFLCSGDQQNLTSIVQTDKGPVQGEIRETVWNSVPYSSFRGIRYGKPPLGYARFKPPQEAEPWNETFQATSEATPCPQIGYVFDYNYFGDEDCLNLNVYTPKTNFSDGNEDEKLKPVMVWIYGGSFKDGYTNITFCGPDFLIEDGVVVVAMNYRMGVLGFLSLDVANATGNAGLKDQLLALKWVQRNIKSFGGDPSSVTIFGESAGGISVDFYVLSDKSRGFFHRALSMSGTPLSLSSFTPRAEAHENAFQIGKILGIHSSSKETLLEGLYNQSVEAIVKASQQIKNFSPFKPTLENPKIAGDNGFLTNCALNKYKSGNFSQVPYLTGFMANETLTFLVVPHALEGLLKNSRDLLKQINSSSILASLPKFKRKIIEDTTKDAEQSSPKARNAIIQITTDILYVAGTDMKQRLMTKYGSQPVYYYRNSFATNQSLHTLLGIDILGAGHVDDIAYCWHIPAARYPTDPDDPLVITQKRVTRMWTNFAKYSNPTPNGTDDKLLNIVWPVSGAEGKHLEIGKALSVGPRPINKFVAQFQRHSEPLIAAVSGCNAVKV